MNKGYYRSINAVSVQAQQQQQSAAVVLHLSCFICHSCASSFMIWNLSGTHLFCVISLIPSSALKCKPVANYGKIASCHRWLRFVL
jgi:hypothetical protein